MLFRSTTSQNNRVIIFDTTMRDGEQSPGASMTKEEKIRIARQLEKMGVDVIEAGFAAASPGDFESVNAIAKIITKSTILIIAAPSGAGKTTLVRALLQARPHIRHSVSFTTRAPRVGEKHGEDYFFTDEPDFMARRDAGEFLE